MQTSLVGNYGVKNLGDELMLQGFFDVLHGVHPECTLHILSGHPEEYANTSGIKATAFMPMGRSILRGQEFSHTLFAYKQSSAVFFGGGGLFTDEKWKAPLIWFWQMLWATKFFTKKHVWVSQSVGPLKTWLGRALTRFVANRASHIIVRDQASVEVLASLHIKTPVQLLPDLAFMLRKKQPPVSPLSGGQTAPSLIREGNLGSVIPDNDVLRSDPGSRKKQTDVWIPAYAGMTERTSKRIIISLRPWMQHQESIIASIAAFIDTLYKGDTGYSFVFVPFQINIDNDLDIAIRLKAQLDPSVSFEILDHVPETQEVLDLYQTAYAVIGMRLHATILAAMCGVPYIALSYSSKVTAMSIELGMGDYTIDIRDLTGERILELFHKLEQDYQGISDRLGATAAHKYEECEKGYREIMASILQ